MTLTMFNRHMTAPAEDECGHLVTVVDGEHQHHDIPDDAGPARPDQRMRLRATAIHRERPHRVRARRPGPALSDDENF